MKPKNYSPNNDNNIMLDEVKDLLQINQNNFLKLKAELEKDDRIKSQLDLCFHFTDLSTLPLQEHMQKVKTVTGFYDTSPFNKYAVEYLTALENVDAYLSELKNKIQAGNNLEKEYEEFQAFKKSFIEFRKFANSMSEFFTETDKLKENIDDEDLYAKLTEDEKNALNSRDEYKRKLNEKKLDVFKERQDKLRIETEALNTRANQFLQSMDITLPQKIYAAFSSFLIGCVGLIAGIFVAMPFYLGKAIVKQDKKYLKDAVSSPTLVPYYAAKKTYDDMKLGFIQQNKSIFGKFGLYHGKANQKAEIKQNQIAQELQAQIEHTNNKIKPRN